MSATAETTIADSVAKQGNHDADQLPGNAQKSPANYQGFVAGVFSGTAKLAGMSIPWLPFDLANAKHLIVGHPFDTIKVRLQTSKTSQFRGPLDCLLQTVRNEGVRALYKGATPPLVGWMVMDSVLMGSLTFYRNLLNDNIFNPRRVNSGRSRAEDKKLPPIGHAIAGVMAGCTVSFVAAPVEHVKARLQVQYQAEKRKRLYSGPIDCTKKLVCLSTYDYHLLND